MGHGPDNVKGKQSAKAPSSKTETPSAPRHLRDCLGQPSIFLWQKPRAYCLKPMTSGSSMVFLLELGQDASGGSISRDTGWHPASVSGLSGVSPKETFRPSWALHLLAHKGPGQGSSSGEDSAGESGRGPCSPVQGWWPHAPGWGEEVTRTRPRVHRAHGGVTGSVTDERLCSKDRRTGHSLGVSLPLPSISLLVHLKE